MVTHASSDGKHELMGIMQGKSDGHSIIVMDVFPLPTINDGEEEEGCEYILAYLKANKLAGRLEPVVGWYHSHPGYGCWLSDEDISTQRENQHQEPFVAVVIDPTRTLSTGKVNIGAFRTYPEDYNPGNGATIPSNKIEDYRAHCKKYYSLDITCFKSSLDNELLDELWKNTLSSSAFLANTTDFVGDQISDIADKIEQMANSSLITTEKEKKIVETELKEISLDSAKMATEQIHGLMSQVIKRFLFHYVGQSDQAEAMAQPQQKPL